MFLKSCLRALAGILLVMPAMADNSSGAAGALQPDPSNECYSCEAWNELQQPFRVYGNTYYVGMAGVSAVLIDGGSELVLIDAGLPQSAKHIEANVRALGFDPANITLILLSHAHFDHAGGINAMQRYTGAEVLASPAAAAALRRGDLLPDDPQYDQPVDGRSFPAVRNVVAVEDGSEYVFGDGVVRAISTPGHTPGGMSWTWTSCEDGRCLAVVYADSIGPVSVDSYRFSDGLGDAIARSARIVRNLDCDIFLSTHPFTFEMRKKYEQGRHAFIDPEACKAYGEATLHKLEERLAEEEAAFESGG